MVQGIPIEDRILVQYQTLSAKLQLAADYVSNNPIDVATRSLRSVASTSGISPATYSRLSRALGYEDYEALREDARRAMGAKMSSFAERAQALQKQSRASSGRAVLQRHASACISNIEHLERDLSEATLEAVACVLHNARRVMLVGSLGTAGFVEYFGYLARWFREGWDVAAHDSTGLAACLARLTSGDAVLVISKAPYAHRSIAALRAAKQGGVSTILITDTHACPGLAFADHAMTVPSESPQFFSSYVTTLVLIETLITMLLAKSGSDAEQKISAAEDQIKSLGETWTP